MEDISWVLYALLGALLATQVILVLLAADDLLTRRLHRRAMMVGVQKAINSQTGDLLIELRGIRNVLRTSADAISNIEGYQSDIHDIEKLRSLGLSGS